MRTVCRATGSAGRAVAAGGVDVANDAPTFPFLRTWRLLYHADELVTRDAAKLHVSLYQFQVSVADAG